MGISIRVDIATLRARCWNLAALVSLAACVQPIHRDTAPEPVKKAAVVEKKSATPDLKKHLWVVSFKDHPKPPAPLKDVSVGDMVQKKLIETLAQGSAYIPQSSEEEEAFRGNPQSDISSGKTPLEIARVLKGSDVAGFLVGEIEHLDITQSGGDSEGLVKSRTVKFDLGVKWELYDAASARRIGSGTETSTYSETRSDLFGTLTQIPELDRHASEMSSSLAGKISEKLTAFSEKLAWGGRVLRIDGPRVYLNAGRRTGILVGDVLKIVDVPRAIDDPTSGQFVGAAPGRIKGTVKVVQYFGLDGAVAVLQSGGGIFAGDRVELF